MFRAHYRKHPYKSTKTDSLEDIDDVGSEDNATKISKTSPLQSDIIKVFDKELCNKRVEFEKDLQEQRE